MMARPSNTLERRAQITDGLLRVMAERGYDGASISDVAKAAGLAPGLVHYHFANKLEILLALQAGLAARHEEALEAVLAAAEEPVAAIGAFVDHHLALGRSADPDALTCWVMLAGEALRSLPVRDGHTAVLTRLTDRLSRLIRDGVHTKQLTAKSPESAAAAIVAAIQGYYLLAATARPLIPRGSAAVSVRAMAAGLLGCDALRTSPRRRRSPAPARARRAAPRRR